MHSLSVATMLVCSWFLVWVDIKILIIFNYKALAFYHLTLGGKSKRVLGLHI